MFVEVLTSLSQFVFDENTGAKYSCSAMVGGEMMIFGGSSSAGYTNQISIVQSCRLKRVGTLPMQTFNYGACNTFKENNGMEKTLLCFDSSGRRSCHR